MIDRDIVAVSRYGQRLEAGRILGGLFGARFKQGTGFQQQLAATCSVDVILFQGRFITCALFWMVSIVRLSKWNVARIDEGKYSMHS